MNCTSCGAKIPDGWANCKVCGATAPDERGIVCERCGKRAKPGERFCGGCGNSLVGTPRVTAEPAPPAIKKKFNPYPILITLVAAIIVILGAISLSDSDFTAYGRGYESTVEKYVDYHCKGEWDEKLTLQHEDITNELYDSRYDAERELAIRGDNFVNSMDEQCGYNWSYTYTIIESENLTGSEFEEGKEFIQEEYGVSITAAKEIEVELEIKGYKGEKTRTLYLILVKIGWDWYIYSA